MHILFDLGVLAVVEDQHTVHLLIGCNNIMSPLGDAVDLTPFCRVADCSRGVLFIFFAARSIPSLTSFLLHWYWYPFLIALGRVSLPSKLPGLLPGTAARTICKWQTPQAWTKTRGSIGKTQTVPHVKCMLNLRETGLLELLIQLPKNVKMYQIRAPVPFWVLYLTKRISKIT